MADEGKPKKRTRRAAALTAASLDRATDAATAAADAATNLNSMRNAVVDAAGTSTGLWLSYLFALFYLLVAVGSVTHRDLLLESPIKLPFLGVELPLIGFFALGPLLFLVVHAYVLLHMAMLAGKVSAFHDVLQAQNMVGELDQALRRQLPSNFLVQALAGPSDVRNGIFGFMLRLIGYITLVAGPVALLLFFQLQFLPYHHDWLTWWHRVAVAADLALLWTIWPPVAHGKTTLVAWRGLCRARMIAIALASLMPLLLAFTIATFPGERLESLPSLRLIPTQWPSLIGEAKDKGKMLPLVVFIQSMGWTSLHELLVAGEVDPVTSRPRSLWSDRIVSPYLDTIDGKKFDTEAKFAAARETVSLRGRHLEGAILVGARLRKVDLTAAYLQDARLDGADLREAKLECASESLKQCANLAGASLSFARLQGALLIGAELYGAFLTHAQLQGALLSHARLQGAQLNYAQLQGAQLEFAQLQGASFFSAELQGTSFFAAELQGAVLAMAQLQGASFRFAFVWRTSPPKIDNKTRSMILVAETKTEPIHSGLDCFGRELCHWSTASFAALKRIINEQVPEGGREAALAQVAVLDPEKAMDTANAWAELARSSPGDADYANARAKVMQDTGCAAEGAPYVARRLTRWLLTANISARARLAAAFLDSKQCPGARGLSEAYNDALRQICGPPCQVAPSTSLINERGRLPVVPQ